MKRKMSIMLAFALMLSMLASCSDSISVKQDTPDNALLSLSLTLGGDNYDNFNALFSDGRKNTVSEETLKEFSKATSAAFDNSLYGLVTYSNGEMFLVKLSVKKIDGEYKVEDVVKVPEEMKKLFQRK
jgi:hypothetical protein